MTATKSVLKPSRSKKRLIASRHTVRSIDIANLRHEASSGREMGFGAGKSPPNRTRCSLSPSSAQTVELASTDTPSDVSVAASEECHRFATHSATDRRLIRPENVRAVCREEERGRGFSNRRGRRFVKSDVRCRKFSANAISIL